MAEQTEKRWIVLINKSPRGPFTQEEVKYLLEEGLVRRNDVAFEVSQEGDEVVSGWKILWQFPEFERRDDTNTGEHKIEPKPEVERRERFTPRKAEVHKDRSLPHEVAEISPEELLLRSKVNPNISNSIDDLQKDIEDTMAVSSSSDSSSAGLGGLKYAIGSLLAVLAVFAFFKLKPAEEPKVTRGGVTLQKPTASKKRKLRSRSGSPLSNIPIKGKRQTASALDDLEKIINKKKEEDADSGFIPANDHDDEVSEEEPRKPKKKKKRKKKKKKKQVEDIEDEDFDEEGGYDDHDDEMFDNQDDELPPDEYDSYEDEYGNDEEYYD